jgi:DNA topoisomerase-3
VLNTTTNKTHTICPYCFSHTPDIENIEGSTHNGFRCFQCTFECPLAKGKNTNQSFLCQCPSCKTAKLALRDNKDGTKKFIGCQGFPKCRYSIFLPIANSIQVLDDTCLNCSTDTKPVKLMQFTFDPGKYNAIGELTGCVFCDSNINSLVTVSSGTNSSTFSSNGSSKNNRQDESHSNRQGDSRTVAKRRRLSDDENQPTTSNRTFTRITEHQNNRTNQNTSKTSYNIINNSNGSSGIELCDCGLPVRILVSRTEKTAGRKFAKCSKDRNEQCKYFQWIDE